jgi:hypothetical protein
LIWQSRSILHGLSVHLLHIVRRKIWRIVTIPVAAIALWRPAWIRHGSPAYTVARREVIRD